MPLTFPPTITSHPSTITAQVANLDSGALCWDGTNFWQTEEEGGNLVLVKYDSSGAFVSVYTLVIAGWGGVSFGPMISLGGFLWAVGIATSTRLAKILVTAGVPAVVNTFDITVGGSTTNSGIGYVCADGTNLYTIAPYNTAGPTSHIAVTKLDTTGAVLWQTTKTPISFGYSNIVTDNTYVYYTLDKFTYQDKCVDGTNHASHDGTFAPELNFFLAYSTVNSVLWAADTRNKFIYNINPATMAITSTIDVGSFVSFVGNMWSLVVDVDGNIWLAYDQNGPPGSFIVFNLAGAQLWQHDFATTSVSAAMDFPEFPIAAIGSQVWGGIQQSADNKYALLQFSFATPVVVLCNNPQSGVVGMPYEHTFTASGGTGPYTFAITAGALPTGLAMNSAGMVSGTPSVAGTFTFTVTATDSLSATASIVCSIDIIARPAVNGFWALVNGYMVKEDGTN